jgi:glycoprotein endo-alpha-1,2-mannosidase
LPLPESTRLQQDSTCRVHVFFYAWYGNPQVDGNWSHWNHQILPFWNPSLASQWPTGVFQPPGDVGSASMPKRGLYSSRDQQVLTSQFKELASLGLNVISLSWWGPKHCSTCRDGQGSVTDEAAKLIMEIAEETGIYVNFHLEPYPGRNVESIRQDLDYILKEYGHYQSFFRNKKNHKAMVYVYDSYLIPEAEWHRLLSRDGDLSIRHPKNVWNVIGLLVEEQHKNSILQSGFDGFYTYFAADQFTFGSTQDNWKSLGKWARENNLIFVPSVGPGYDDRRIRPWNSINYRPRNHGEYYKQAWRKAIASKPDFITVTSYNEWHEGTQIEAVIPFVTSNRVVLEDYNPESPEYYLDLTRKWKEKYEST